MTVSRPTIPTPHVERSCEFNQLLRRADKDWPSSWGVGCGANNCSP